jgi:membrane protein DedA with SNARE-associated domain
MLASLITSYGYWALFLGTLLEGETIVIVAAIAAQIGYLDLHWVIIVAFFGSLLGDQIFFLIGRYRGRKFLDKRPAWQMKAEKAHRILEKHQLPVMLGFRFLYGLRTIIPFAIGTSKISAWRFALFNIIGAAIWSTAFSYGGYWFGTSLEIFLHNFKHYEKRLILLIVLVGLLGWLIGSFRERLKRVDEV